MPLHIDFSAAAEWFACSSVSRAWRARNCPLDACSCARSASTSLAAEELPAVLDPRSSAVTRGLFGSRRTPPSPVVPCTSRSRFCTRVRVSLAPGPALPPCLRLRRHREMPAPLMSLTRRAIVFPFGPLRGKSMSTGRFRRIISARNKRSDHLIIIISSQLPTSSQAVNDS